MKSQQGTEVRQQRTTLAPHSAFGKRKGEIGEYLIVGQKEWLYSKGCLHNQGFRITMSSRFVV